MKETEDAVMASIPRIAINMGRVRTNALIFLPVDSSVNDGISFLRPFNATKTSEPRIETA